MSTAKKETDYLYTPLFCEENIWHLAKALQEQGIDKESMQVLLLSNPARRVVLFHQQQRDDRGYVVWDYHVVLRLQQSHSDLIYDFDTRMPFPVATRDYFKGSFPVPHMLKNELMPFVREIPAASYLKNFSSDRSHMQEKEGVGFPEWSPILPSHSKAVGLNEYWDMQRFIEDGSRVYDLGEYLETHLK